MTENDEAVKETTDSGSSPEETTAEDSTESSEEQIADESSEKTEKTPSEGTEEESTEQSEQEPADSTAGEDKGSEEEPKIPLEHLQNERARRRRLEEELDSLKKAPDTQTTQSDDNRKDELKKFLNEDGTFNLEAYDRYRDEKEQQSVQQQQQQLQEQAKIREAMAQDVKTAEEKYPELAKSQPLQDAVMAHAQREGIKISQAADEVMAGVRQQTTEAKQEGKAEGKSEMSRKEKAQTLESGKGSSKSEEQQLREQMSSDDPRERDEAIGEWLKIQNKRTGRTR